MQRRRSSIENEPDKQRICDLMESFHNLGWCSGSGGGCSTRSSLTGSRNILVAPSGVQKEMMSVDDIIILDSTSNVIENCNDLKPSACLSIFNEIYLNSSSCSAIIHSHSSVFVKLTNLFLGAEFKCQYFEMIKGVNGHENDEVLVIPIIDNTRTEEELASSVAACVKIYPRSPAVLVRNHGIYVWGKSWSNAKVHAECIDYLATVCLDMERTGLATIEGGVCKPNSEFGRKNEKPRVWRVPEVMVEPGGIGYTEDGVNVIPGRPLKFEDESILEKLGVTYDRLSGREDDQKLDDIKVRDEYKNFDIVELDGGKMEKVKYEGFMTKFFETHYHEDDEVRYILSGGGYFDCRYESAWYRIQVKVGDCICIPEFLWHRFVCDTGRKVRAMRLFKDAPKWEALTDVDQPERKERKE
ncbi:hypothetical protein TrST_g3846 [Triparma strigata]|uniref:Class II aldolase/adducin N-terminal domain-containing protein n=1 Tax=Triparma strigata TaxID=1606541 RepID=A0A9W6ZMW9_9STRA|nr:hypothetical protein TrST_g3846 [Triparma strigata]